MIDVRPLFANPQGWATNNPDWLLGIAIHHSVTANLSENATEVEEIRTLKAVESYHISIGYGMFGYHFATFPSGRIYQIGDILGQRAHVAGRNDELVGIVNMGTFTYAPPGYKQLLATGEGINFIRAALNTYLPASGHNNWALPGNGTACAGAPMNAAVPSQWNKVADVASGDEEDAMIEGPYTYAAFLSENKFWGGKAFVGLQLVNAWHDFGLPMEASLARVCIRARNGYLLVKKSNGPAMNKLQEGTLVNDQIGWGLPPGAPSQAVIDIPLGPVVGQEGNGWFLLHAPESGNPVYIYNAYCLAWR